MATDANGFPIHFEITDGEVHDCKIAPEMIQQLPSAEHTIADIDWNLYKYRHLVEN